MEVTCPKCRSRFNLSADVARPGVKLRCSVCEEIFRLGEQEAKTPSLSRKGFDLDFGENYAAPETARPRTGRRWWWVVLFLLLLGVGVGGWYYQQYLLPSDGSDAHAMLDEKVKLLTMRNVRQYYVKNEKIGQIFVVEGQVVNEFPTPKELIEVEAVIYDKEKKPLSVKKQLAGATLSLFQLQVLGEKELEAVLSNNVEVLTRNTNVRTGDSVPFMVLFYAPPTVAEFGVRIASVRDVDKPL